MGQAFNQHVVFITGGSAGIGAALGQAFTAQGARVALAARSQERLDEVVKSIEAQGGEAMGVVCDVTSRESMDAAVAQVIERWGQIDVSIANAGFGVAGFLQALDTEDYRRQFDTNVFGVLNTIYATLPHVLKTQGRVVLLSSVMGKLGQAGGSAYAMSKFAVTGLAESLENELGRQGVSVTCIHPGFVHSRLRMTDNTSTFKEGRRDPVPAWLVVPTDVASRAMLRAIRKRKRDVTITVHGKVIVALHRLFPGGFALLMRFLSRGKLNKKDQAAIEAYAAKNQ